MKVKKFIGQNINGFKILDSYVKTTPNGKKTRKVLLKCENCGREFERQSGVDFDHIKCKCKCKYLKPKKSKYHFVEWEGEKYTLTDFCRNHSINPSTFMSRVNGGMSIEEAVQKEFVCKCKICDKEFIAKRPDKMFCCSTCYKRASRGKGQYKEKSVHTCIICGKKFEHIDDKAITCSKKCRYHYNWNNRNQRYKELRKSGKFDVSITLKKVYDKFDGVCQGCGKKLDFFGDHKSNEYPSIDHIIPISRGGSHTWENVQLLCRLCNDKKGVGELKKKR